MSLLLNSDRATQQFARQASVARACGMDSFIRRGARMKSFGTGAGSEDMDDTDEQHGDPCYREPLGC